MSSECIKPPSTFDSSLNPLINYISNGKKPVKVDGCCLKGDKLIFTHKTKLNFFIAYEIDLWLLNIESKCTLGNSLSGTFKLAKILILISILILDMVLDARSIFFQCQIILGLVGT